MSRSCPLCNGESELQTEHAVSVTSGSRVMEVPSQLWLCRTCGHAHSSAAIDWHAYYANEYDSVLTDDGPDELVAMPDGSTLFRTDFDYRVFRAALPSLHRGQRVFEFGAGRGRILSRLATDGFRNLAAYDVSELYRAPLAKVVGEANVFIGRRSTRECDVAISFFALEHDVDPKGSLAHLHALLAPRGQLFLALPNPLTNQGDFACVDHMHHYTPSVLFRLLLEVGFRDIAVDTSHGGMQTIVARRGTATVGALNSPHAFAEARSALEPYLALKARLDGLGKRMDSSRPTFLYGAGFYATLAHAVLRQSGVAPAGVFDANPHKQGTERFGCTVRPPSSIAEENLSDANLLLCVSERVATALRPTYAPSFHQVLAL